MKLYVAEGSKKRELEMAMKNQESDYDSDLNRTMFQEFWKDLKTEFKPKPKLDATLQRASKSVSRAGGLEASRSTNAMSGAKSAMSRF